jgi:hypothetical protein
VTSDADLFAYRELDDALGLSAMAGESLADARTGKNGRHALVGMLRQAVFGEKFCSLNLRLALRRGSAPSADGQAAVRLTDLVDAELDPSSDSPVPLDVASLTLTGSVRISFLTKGISKRISCCFCYIF